MKSQQDIALERLSATAPIGGSRAAPLQMCMDSIPTEPMCEQKAKIERCANAKQI